jgi:glycosyltransferase involved in cell wall biosynthesis
VFTLHDLTFLSHPELHTVGNRVETLCAVVEAVCAADAFIAVSEHTKAQAVELLGLADERITVIHEAADPAFKPVERDERQAEVRRRLGIDGPFLLTVGSLEPRKNLGRLLDALAALPEDVRVGHGLVVTGGPGWRNRALRERIEGAGCAMRVHLTGEVSQPDLAVLYSAAEAFVYPSLSEGFGLPVLEAMACGAPVITSSTSSLPEVAGEAAVLVDPTDTEALAEAVARVLSDSALRRELRARGFHRVAEFSWQRTARKTLGLYRRLLGE